MDTAVTNVESWTMEVRRLCRERVERRREERVLEREGWESVLGKMRSAWERGVDIFRVGFVRDRLGWVLEILYVCCSLRPD